MILATFEDLLDRHGGDIDRWPAAERAGARLMLESSAAARQAHAAMGDVEQVLAALRPSLGAGGTDAIVAIATRGRQARPVPRLVTRAGWGAAAAALLGLGVLVGGALPAAHDESPEHVLWAAIGPAGSIDVD